MAISHRRTFIKASFGLLAATALSLPGARTARAQGSGAIVPLPDKLAKAAKKFLPGVVGEPVPAFTIDPSMASLSPGQRTYQIVHGENAGQTETHSITAEPKGSGTKWRYTVGDTTVFLKVDPGVSLAIAAQEDRDQGVISRFTPPEPLLVAGMNAGDIQTETIAVKVYDLDDPTDLDHQGTLNLTLTYVGAYKVTVPAGTYDAALLLWSYNGSVGPASIEDIQARFVAPGVGMVAAAERRDISAMLVYNDDSKIGRVLVQA